MVSDPYSATPLKARYFSSLETEPGKEVIVPVVSLFKNPLTYVLGITALIGLLKIWANVDLLTAALPGVDPIFVQSISDSVLTVVVPILGIIIELNRKSVNTVA